MFGYIHRKDIFMKENLKKLIFPVILILISLSGCGSEPQVVIENKDTLESEENKIRSTDISETDRINEVYVYVTGKVRNPDVYKVPEDYRIYQVIELAGGFLEDAEIGNINLAGKIFDGMHITVYAIGEEAVYTYNTYEEGNNKDSHMININTASREELMTLPGIGETKADSIISYRNENGRFNSIEDIMKISGIKEGAFEKIKSYITV